MSKEISIYIVEDYMLSRINLLCLLKNKYNVAGNFSSAEECLEALKHKSVDIVIMDLGLPNMNGIEATKLIKQHFPETKVVVFTSYESEDVVKAAISCGANAYCTKDIKMENFLTALNLVAEGAFWLDPKIAKVAFDIIPKPVSTDFSNLYHPEQVAVLTEREDEVLTLVAQGMTNPEIAKRLCISKNTVKAHVCHIMKKFDVKHRSEIIVKAIKKNLI